MGDSVNVASRIQSLGQANTILFSKEVFDKLKNQPEYKAVSLGKFEFKNVDEPLEIFALANEGCVIPKREQMSGKLKEIKKKSVRKKIIIVCIFLIVLIASFLLYKSLSPVKAFAGERSIAILPFTNMSNDKDNEYFSDGMTDGIITHVSKIASLKVISRTSIMLYKNTKKSLKQIAEELGVSFILEGGIQRSGNSVRINAQLIDVASDNHVWAEIYDRSIKEIFSIQSEVAQNIAEALKAKLTLKEKTGLSKHYTDNVDAYRFYRKGRYFWDARTKESFDSAEVNYKKAIELDPDYALAYSGLADLYIYNQKGLTQVEAIPIAKDYANKALSLDSTLVEALTTIGFIQSGYEYDWKSAKQTLEKAIRLDPNYAYAHIFFGNLLQYTGENTQRGIEEVKKARSLDPLSVSINWILGRNYYMARRYDSAYEVLTRTLALNPRYQLAKGTLALVALAKKNYPEAFRLIKQIDTATISKSSDVRAPYYCYALALSGDTLHAKEELQKFLTANPSPNPYQMSRIYIALNNYDEALNWLDQAYNVRQIALYFINVDPTFDPLRNEPRFKALLKKVGLE